MCKLSWRRSSAVLAAILLSGCAGMPLDQGRSNVQSLVQARATPALAPTAPDAQVAQWLAESLSLENAQRIALLRNPRLRIGYARLGLEAAEVFEAGRLANPVIGLSWLWPLGGAEGSKGGLSASFTGLLLRGTRQRVAAAEFSAAQQALGGEVMAVLADTQRAWFECVAATQRLAVRRTIADAAALSADLAESYLQAGNISELELQVQRAESSQALIGQHAAEMALADARASLQRLLGLSAREASWTVPTSLPELPEQPATRELAALQALALEQRLDLAAARRRAEAAGERRRAAHRFRYASETRLGAELDREADASKRLGPSLELSLPLFQQGQGATTRADAELAAAQAAVVELENGISLEVAQQLQRLESSRLQAQAYRGGLIPQREAVVARLKEQANFMLVDSFAVLLARQQEYAAYAGYIEAAEGYWINRTELLRAVGTLRGLEETR